VSELKPFELGIAILGQSLILATLVGLIVRKHIQVCWFFAFYLSTVFLTDLLAFLGTLPPAFLAVFDNFDRLAFWFKKEAVLNGLKFAVAFELIGRCFSRFPGAHATARRVFWLATGFAVVSTIWLAASWTVPAGVEPDSREAAALYVSTFQPRVLTATTWLFVAITGLVLWYRLPITNIQKAILIGFVPILLFSYLVLELRTANHWPKEGWMTGLDTWAYMLLLGYWARSAWQPFREIVPPGGRQRVTAVSESLG